MYLTSNYLHCLKYSGYTCLCVYDRILSSNKSHIVKLSQGKVRQNPMFLAQKSQRIKYSNYYYFNCAFSDSPPAVLSYMLSCLFLKIFCCTLATQVHAHTPSVPADQQPSVQGGPFSSRKGKIWQHLRFPVSELKAVPPT